MAPELQQNWTTAGLIDHFVKIHHEMPDRAFCFVLGAGASVTSGIPTGAQLVRTWLGELQRQLDPEHERRKLEDWATADTLGIEGFEFSRAAEFYPQIFDLRFRDDPEEGYAALEAVMTHRDRDQRGPEPSLGYSIMAQILSGTRHRVVITTNFDNLVTDALLIYTNTHPFVCGHESLTGYVHARMRRPLVAKIHRDLLLAPFNDKDEVARLKKGWDPVMRELFRNYSPIFVGYGGNDGSLMGLLEALKPGEIVGRLIWCYWHKEGLPKEDIRRLVAKHRGAMVSILGFDELMLQLGDKLKLPLLASHIEERARQRVERYREAVEAIKQKLGMPAESGEAERQTAHVREALDAAITRNIEQPRGPFDWDLKAQREPNLEKREIIYREGMDNCPRSSELAASLGQMLAPRRPNEAEELLRSAVEWNDGEARYKGLLARFYTETGKNAGEADRLYLEAAEQDQNNVELIVEWADFVARILRDATRAERLYKRALSIEPLSPLPNAHYARFLGHVRKDAGLAAEHWKHTRTDDGNVLPQLAAQYAAYLSELGGAPAQAEGLLRRLLTSHPNDVRMNVLLAALLVSEDRLEEARERIGRVVAASAGSVIGPPSLYAMTALLRGALARAADDGDDDDLGRLKTLFGRGFGRDFWFTGRLVAALKRRLPAGDADLYAALAEAVLDERKVAALIRFTRWEGVGAVDLDAEWGDSAPAAGGD